MSKKNKDIFLQYLGEVTPIKKSNKNFKKIKKTNFSSSKKYKKNTIINIGLNKNVQKNDGVDQNFKIEASPLNKKLKKGKIPIDKKIDFHGFSTNQAKKIFIETINDCFYANKRCILFVTGKGINRGSFNNTNKKLYHGKIRNNFLEWVNQKEAASKILNMSPAGFLYGGDGAFFIYLRKNKH